MKAFVLKSGATLFTIGTTMVSAVFVTSHLKNPAAPLQPPVLSAGQGQTASTHGGTITIGPSVQSSDVQPVTSTYAS
jgi:hypothetical protein